MVSSEVSIYLKNGRVQKASVDEAIQYYSDEVGENTEKELLFRENGSVQSFEFDESLGEISFDIVLTDGSSFCASLPMNDDVLASVMQYAVKRLNKFKTVLEGLK